MASKNNTVSALTTVTFSIRFEDDGTITDLTTNEKINEKAARALITAQRNAEKATRTYNSTNRAAKTAEKAAAKKAKLEAQVAKLQAELAKLAA